MARDCFSASRDDMIWAFKAQDTNTATGKGIYMADSIAWSGMRVTVYGV